MLAIYVHIPFCESKCSYCGFYSTRYDPALADRFISSIFTEIETRRPLWEGRSVTSIYVGGGTPSSLSLDQMEQLLSGLWRRLPLTKDPEATIEMNPGSTIETKCDRLRSLGITRVSIGVQSFSDTVLARLGRRHTSDDAVEAVRLAKGSGIRSVGIDLLYGLPGQSVDDWDRTIGTAVTLRPDHLSCYGLSLEEGSPLAAERAAGSVALPADETVAEMYELVRERLLAEGYGQYELSNFALPSHACRHNLHYWGRGEYIGLGPSASSFIDTRRWTNVSSLERYTDLLRTGRPVIAEEEQISEVQAASERLFLGLRRTEGIDLVEYTAQCRPSLGLSFDDQVSALCEAGLVTQIEGRLRLTSRGMLLSNEVMARLIP